MSNQWSQHGQGNGGQQACTQPHYVYNNCQIFVAPQGNAASYGGNAHVPPQYYGGHAGGMQPYRPPATTRRPSSKYPAWVRQPQEPTLGGPYKGKKLQLQPRDADSCAWPCDPDMDWEKGTAAQREGSTTPISPSSTSTKSTRKSTSPSSKRESTSPQSKRESSATPAPEKKQQRESVQPEASHRGEN